MSNTAKMTTLTFTQFCAFSSPHQNVYLIVTLSRLFILCNTKIPDK